MPYKLLERFAELFDGNPYRHRKSNLGDSVAMRLFEDLYDLGRSGKFKRRVESEISVLSAHNRTHGVKARRGDGTFGEVVPNSPTIIDAGFSVRRGEISNIEIGVEVKILAKAMIKQIDRVINDLGKQRDHFRSKNGNSICVGIVGVNWAPQYTSYEADRTYPTDGKKYAHPISEAAEAEARLMREAAPLFDEFIVLQFEATNTPPFEFSWCSGTRVEMDYGAALTRISQQYEQRVN